jgi:CBS domain-containing membrane protein
VAEAVSDRQKWLTAAAEHLLPAMVLPRGSEMLRAAGAIGLTLGLAALMQMLLGANDARFSLIAPLAATTFLLISVPNSPLTQPWSVVIGNGASAAVAVTVLQFGLPVPLTIALAVGGATLAMMLLRAMHPPGAAVAMAAVLSAPATMKLGYQFALTPVMLDSTILVIAAIAVNRLTGRVYPFRLPHDATAAPRRADRPSPEVLERILGDLRLSANIGVEDLRRVLDEIEKREKPPVPHRKPRFSGAVGAFRPRSRR